MKRSYISVSIIFMFFCSTIFPVVSGMYDDDVPIWDVGDIWVYTIDDLDYIDESGDTTMNAHLIFGDLTLEVVEVIENSYILSFDVKVNGDFEIYFGDYSIRLDGRISRLFATKLKGSLSIKKSDLSVESFDVDLSCILRVKIREQPLVPFPIPALYIPLRVNLDFSFQGGLPIIEFPLFVEKTWTLPSIIFTIDGQIRSIWLNVVKFVVRIASNFGFDIVPPEIANLLPRIDIGNLIIALKGDNIITIDSSIWQDTPLMGIDTYSEITVPAGTYNAYDIILPISLGNLYYSTDVGNIIKMTIGPMGSEINMELKETNFS